MTSAHKKALICTAVRGRSPLRDWEQEKRCNRVFPNHGKPTLSAERAITCGVVALNRWSALSRTCDGGWSPTGSWTQVTHPPITYCNLGTTLSERNYSLAFGGGDAGSLARFTAISPKSRCAAWFLAS